MNTIQWTASELTNAKPVSAHASCIEFQDNSGEWHYFEVLLVPASSNNPQRIVFGGFCNAGFLESGYISQADCESIEETISEMIADLECYYNDGPKYVSRIVCNDRM